MTPATRWIVASLFLPPLALTYGCSTTAKPAAPHEPDVRALMSSVMSAPDVDARTAAALEASTRGTSELGNALKAIDRARAVVQHNLANADTTAFKSTRALCQGGGSLRCQPDWEQGSLESSNRPLDLAIQGPGFFKIRVPKSINVSGVAYTRNGNCFINKDGVLVLGMADSYTLLPAITVPAGASDISIDQEGVVNILQPGKAYKQPIGQLELTHFANVDGLETLNGTLFAATEASGVAIESRAGSAGNGVILQGFLERSNVDLTRETLRLQFLDQWRAVLVGAHK